MHSLAKIRQIFVFLFQFSLAAIDVQVAYLLGTSDIYSNASSDKVCQAVDSMTRVIKSNSSQRNKFTEGLDFASIVDWTSELRPSMKKLRQAMDGLLKTARLTHSVFRVQEDAKSAHRVCNVRYRRDVCFSQAVSIFLIKLILINL